VAGKVVPNDELLTKTSLQPGRSQFHKPLFVEEHVDPAILAAVILPVFWSTPLPSFKTLLAFERGKIKIF
jgi:hypothetical protein